MPRTLILYATIEGHTAKIVQHIAHRLQALGHVVEMYRADSVPVDLQPSSFDGVIIGASIHYGHHPGYFRALVRRLRAALAARPGAFFSVSLSAGGPGARPKAAQRYLETFLRQVDWQPALTMTFAGALQYSKYGTFRKLLMRMIVGHAGGDTDTSRDYEYTDWAAVDHFADVFAQRLQHQ